MKTIRLVLIIAAMLLVSRAAAQEPAGGRAPVQEPAAQAGPAGNTHPAAQLLARTASAANPFGAPAGESTMDEAAKAAFARSVDLSPLRDLAVQHNGRVKILDTLARETVSALTGRHDFVDFIHHENGEIEKVKYDPLFTMLDMMIDPAYYVHKPLIHVNYLPLREAYLELAFPDDPGTRLRWKKLTRVSPAMVESLGGMIFDNYGDSPPFREGIQRAENANDLFAFGVNNLLMIAPESSDKPWRHLATAPAGSPVASAAERLGAAWRSGDAAGVNEAAKALAAALPTINPAQYPATKRALELTYNRVNAFEWGYWVYLLSLLALVLAFGTGRKWLIVTGVSLLVAALALHAFGFTMRCLVAERFAIQNQFESMTGLSLFAVVVGLVIMLARRQWLFGAAAAACGFLVLIFATQTAIPGKDIGREAAILNTSVLLKYHVTTVLTSYGLITLGFVCSVFYLATHYGAKLMGTRATPALAVGALGGGDAGGSSGGKTPTLARTLADLDTAQMTILQLAFWTLGVGILLGAWWADHSWGRWWAFDPKETWALLTWIVYLIVIHVRFAVKNKGLVTAWLSIAGFVVMLWTYFGVNLLLPGLHAYA